jgi:hypothetical protein
MHQLAIDLPCCVEFFLGSPQLFPGFEQLSVEFGHPPGELAVGEFGKGSVGEQLVCDQLGALGLGESSLE